ncbi:MAG TPA: hypothetical protein PLO23_04295, partial [Alphaproteobacteria bacterium]|nr:hypothetical protein [Alphaproteobacteria bacterium]
MIKKRISVLALLALSGSILGLFALSGTAISQDYVAPDQAQEEAGKPEEKSTSPAAPALETEY